MPLVLNQPTPFKINDHVSVTLIHGPSLRKSAHGFVYMKEMAPVNQALAEGDQTDHIYVAFDDVGVYASWLSRGSMILYNNQKYVVQTMRRSDNGTVESLDVYAYSGMMSLRPVVENISSKDIRAMLIWLVAFDMTQM